MAQQTPHATAARTPAAADPPVGSTAGGYLGFDRNDYPGDDVMARMQRDHAAFAFTGYWLTNPPGAHGNSWLHKREVLKQQGWGFLLLADGRYDKEILRAQRGGVT
ncbi:MAG TPA: hypothetical protein VMF89_35600, partial [Polyangiales bacterium]|nr:hypothetical protein [Polyangiales bacterium]